MSLLLMASYGLRYPVLVEILVLSQYVILWQRVGLNMAEVNIHILPGLSMCRGNVEIYTQTFEVFLFSFFF
jgi:hypothetical protein